MVCDVNNRLIRNIFSLGWLQALNYIVPLVVLPIMIRSLGNYNFGRLSLCISIVNYCLIVVDFGLNMLVTKDVSENRDNRDILSEIFTKTILIKLFLVILIVVIVFALAKYVEIVGDNIKLIFVLYLLVVGQSIFPIWFFAGIENLKFSLIVNTIGKLLYLGLMFFFVREPRDIYMAAVITSSIPFVIGISGVFYVIKKYNVSFLRVPIKGVFLYAKSSFDLFMTNIFTSIYINLPMIVVAGFFGYNAAGSYATAEKIISAFKNVFVPISQAIYPNIANHIKNDENNAKLKIKIFLRFFIVIGVVISILVYYCSDYMVYIVAGNKFNESASLLKIMALLPLFFGISNMLGTNTLFVLGYRKEFVNSLFFASIFGGISILLSGYAFSLEVVSLSIVVTELFVCLLMYAYIKKKKVFKIYP